MAQLHAGCIFCKIIRQEIPCHKLLETEKVLAFLDINPLAPGHALVVPKFHGEKLHDVPEDFVAEVAPTLRKLAIALNLNNYNVLQNNGKLAHQVLVLVAGSVLTTRPPALCAHLQEVPHVHFHLIPKPDGELGLGIKWKSLPTDHAAFSKLAEEIRGKL